MESRQKVIILDITAATLQTLRDYLALGYVIHNIVNLQPSQNKLLIVYYDPALDPINPPV